MKWIKQTCNSLKPVVYGFLRSNMELIETTLKSFKIMDCRMSLKLHMLHAHLNQFKDNMGSYSEEQGERFHQDLMDFERLSGAV